jgi:hypothetical protein
VLICLALLSLESAFYIRGAIQRVAEAIEFVGVFFACSLLPRKMTPTP